MSRRHQTGENDYTGSTSKCGDRRLRTLLFEAENVLLTRDRGPLKLKDWAFAVARRSTMRKARIALVGHEPNIGELAARLIGARAPLEFKKGAICRIDFETFPPKGSGQLRWFASPKMLRDLG